MNKIIKFGLLMCGMLTSAHTTPVCLDICWNRFDSKQALLEQASLEQSPYDHPTTIAPIFHKQTKLVIPVVASKAKSQKYQNCECIICREEQPAKEFCDHKNNEILSCCEVGRNTCKTCIARMCILEEERDPQGYAHPQALHYASNISQEELSLMNHYEHATPETKPELIWYTINGQSYFLEDTTLWHYDITAQEKKRIARWRYIALPKCICGQIYPQIKELLQSK